MAYEYKIIFNGHILFILDTQLSKNNYIGWAHHIFLRFFTFASQEALAQSIFSLEVEGDYTITQTDNSYVMKESSKIEGTQAGKRNAYGRREEQRADWRQARVTAIV